MNPEIDDKALMQRITARDQQALSELYQQYGSRVYHLAQRVVQNTGLAEEITQDTFLKVWNQAHQWDDERGGLLTWLLAVTRYTAIDRLRREERRTPYTAVSIDDMLHLIGEHVDDTVQTDGRLARSLLQQLPPEQAQVIELAYFRAMSHSEMSAHLGLPLGTVKQRVRLGMQKLKDLWQQANLEH